ncbi:MAG: hypothetical protein PQJ46_00700 [Spirochaetales bacterium]|nr:hypothetical protein [Spirochaetales bacterium]
MNKLKYCFIVLFFSLSFLLAQNVFSDTTINIYYTASLNGNLVGCDCKQVPKSGLESSAYFLRERNTDSSILIDLGDFTDVWGDEPLAELLISLYKGLDYDIIAPGEQEFTAGIHFFKKTRRKLPFLNNNMMIDGHRLSINPYVISRKGVKIGVAAIVEPDVFYILPEAETSRLSFISVENASKDALRQLEELDTDYKILLYHGSTASGERLFRSETGWDAVLLAHDQILKQEYIGQRVFASPGEEGNRVGQLELVFRGSRLVKATNSFNIFSYKDSPKDDIVIAAFENYKKELIKNLKNGKK